MVCFYNRSCKTVRPIYFSIRDIGMVRLKMADQHKDKHKRRFSILMVVILDFFNLQLECSEKNGTLFFPPLWYFEGESDKSLLTNKMHEIRPT